MVPRSWILMTLLSCKAESLRVDVPRGGPMSISQDDLRRDQWMRSRLEGQEAQAWLLRRLGEMRLEQVSSTPGSICGGKPGGEKTIWAQSGGDLEGSLRTAAAISLAKGTDAPDAPCPLVFCFTESEPRGKKPGDVVLGLVSGGRLEFRDSVLSSVGSAPSAGEIDYEGLARELRRSMRDLCP